MKLTDFSKHVGLNQLRQQMEAELIPWESGGKWDPIDIELGGEGKEIPPEEIEYAPDGTLGYKGRKVVVYIRDQYTFDSYESVNPDEWVDPEQLCRFHVADCPTLKTMRSQNRYDRYVVATRTDGKFIVNFLVGGRICDKGEKVERRLYVCKNCLHKLDYKNYRDKKTQQNEIRESFDLKAFFEKYGAQITKKPTGNDITAPVNGYSSNWEQISDRYKEKVGWKCEDCDTDLAERKEFLHTHHINAQKSDNREVNLRALCIRCHAEMPQHQRLKSRSKYREYLRWLADNRQTVADFSNQLNFIVTGRRD